MVDIAMHIMDIAQNSIRAEATNIDISIQEDTVDSTIQLSIKDNGKGMNSESLSRAKDPFYTTRTTRRIGLGIPLLKMTCEQTGGQFEIQSDVNAGTIVEAVFKTDHPDCLPMGDIAGYLVLLLRSNPEISFRFSYKSDNKEFCLDTAELHDLGIDIQDVNMKDYIKEYLNENLKGALSNTDLKLSIQKIT